VAYGITGIWGSDPTDVWAVGYGGLIVHYDGSKWSMVPSGVDAGLDGVWGSASDNVWAVGTAGTIVHYP
jgi:hypothetical protein